MLKKTGFAILEMTLIVAVSAGLGYGVNDWRKAGRIQLERSYWFVDPPPERTPSPAPTNDAKGVTPHAHRYPWKVVTLQDVSDLLADPNTEGGANVIIDSRKDELYVQGHIPFAIRITPYEVEREMPPYREQLLAADKVYVYCGGGECEDSSLMCQELERIGVTFDRIFLYEGGFQEWSDNQKPINTGEQP